MTYILQFGRALDIFLNAILGGQTPQTISYRAAVGNEQKKPFWCIVCRFLAWTIQPHHCPDQLATIGMKQSQEFVAFILLLVLSAALILAASVVVHLLILI